MLIAYDSKTGNVRRFIEKLKLPAVRIEESMAIDEPFVLVTPTYGGGAGRGVEKGAVPKQVIRFLNEERNRRNIRGVISAGNTNFGDAFCLAGDIVARKCAVPHLYRLEVFGTPDDVERVTEGLERWWKLS